VEAVVGLDYDIDGEDLDPSAFHKPVPSPRPQERGIEPWRRTWDWRLHRIEQTLPTLEQALAGLEIGLSDAVQRAAEEVISARKVDEPFIVRLGTWDPWLSAHIASNSVRARAVELAIDPDELIRAVMFAGVELDVFAHATIDTFPRLRQTRQLGGHPSRVEDAHDPMAAFQRRLVVELNAGDPRTR
jgi:hypothetical protein